MFRLELHRQTALSADALNFFSSSVCIGHSASPPTATQRSTCSKGCTAAAPCQPPAPLAASADSLRSRQS